MKIITIVGARPNFIKAFLISNELKKQNYKEVIIHTGQHYDWEMNDIFFQDLCIPRPKYNLNLKGYQINQIIDKTIKLIKKENPDIVLIYGDTNSSLAGTIAAFLSHKPIGHVEAGVRSFDMEMAEERNRIIIDHYARLLFCPTRQAYVNLKNEEITQGVFFTGDVMYDSILHFKKKIDRNNYYQNLDVVKKNYYLLTLHRQETVDSREHLLKILKIFKDLDNIIFPIHPRTKNNLLKFGLFQKYIKKFKLTEPVGYLEMLSLVKNAKIVLTDSGGLQKEAFFLHTPCITLLKKTAWPETVKAGWNEVVDLDEEKVKKAVRLFRSDKMLLSPQEYFGDGTAYKKIIKIIEGYIDSNDPKR